MPTIKMVEALGFARKSAPYVTLGRSFALNTGDLFSCSDQSSGAIDSFEDYRSPVAGYPLSSRREKLKKLWHKFFSDPSQWWDHRLEKSHPRYPDFKHKKTLQPLWLVDDANPPWVKTKLATIASGALQSSMFSWNIRLRRYAQAGDYKKTIDVFQQLQREDMIPDKFTFVPVLNACSSLLAVEEGRRIHSEIIKNGLEHDVFVGGCLVDMYAKFGSIDDAHQVFNRMPTRDVVAWSALILGYVKCGQGQEALELSGQMQREGLDLDPITFVGVLNACAGLGALEKGKHAHEQITDQGYESDVYVANALVDMYAKCGSIEDARRVFNKMTTKDVVTWNAMIFGCVKCGEGQEALELSRQMQREGVEFDSLTFVGVLNACASNGALEEGRLVHNQLIGRGYQFDVYVANSLVDMYAKCGSIEDARRIFNNMPTRDVVSWNVMLAGYGLHGHAKESLEGFQQMCQGGVEVNGATIFSLLLACSHAGLVDEGMHYFGSLKAVYGITPTVEHYAYVVDLLGRAGRLHEAEELIRSLPCGLQEIVWMSLPGACRAHGNVALGEYGAKRLLEVDSKNAAGYVLLSNIYAAAGIWDKVHRINHERTEREV